MSAPTTTRARSRARPWRTVTATDGQPAPHRASGARRVVVADAPTWANPATVRSALAQAWGDGQAMLVCRTHRGPSERLAERIWRSWGGQVQPHPDRWDVHLGRHEYRDRSGHRLGSHDLNVSFRGGGTRLVDHHISPSDYTTAVARARRSVAALREQPADARTEPGDRRRTHRDVAEDSDELGADTAGVEDGDQR